MESLKCTSCDIIKDINNFYSLSKVCKECHKEKYKRNKHKYRKPIPGTIYIISNPNFKGWHKVGRVKRGSCIKSRLNAYQTGDPFRSYKIEYTVEVEDTHTIEQHFKDTFNSEYEWHEIPLDSIISEIKLITGS